MNKNALCIDGQILSSRLFVGTGKFSSGEIMQKALIESQTQVVTVALRRVDLESDIDPIMNFIDPEKYILLPNTSGARNADEAVRLAKIAKAFGISNWIKLEITPEPNYLFPDPIETLKASEKLVQMGFVVLPYIQADPILAKRLEDVGTATVMPLASPIGSNQGLKTKELIQIIIEQSRVPVVVDAGLGTPSHANQAMEMGADAVLVNTAIATAQDPIRFARAFKLGVEAGRMAFEAGAPNQQFIAEASSPLTGFLTE